MLHEELINCMKRGNFCTVLSQAFDGSFRQKNFPVGNKFPDDMLINICKILKFSASQISVFALALMQSIYKNLAQEALRLLRLKLPEIESFNDIHDDILHSLVIFVTTSEVKIYIIPLKYIHNAKIYFF